MGSNSSQNIPHPQNIHWWGIHTSHIGDAATQHLGPNGVYTTEQDMYNVFNNNDDDTTATKTTITNVAAMTTGSTLRVGQTATTVHKSVVQETRIQPSSF